MEVDPDFALPAAIAAWCHAQLVTYNGTRTWAEEKALALRLGQRANVLHADDNRLVVTARCAVHTMLNNFETGAALLERALALDPTSPRAWERSGWLKAYLGQSALAVRHFKQAIRLAPAHARNALRYIGIGSACFEAGQYDLRKFRHSDDERDLDCPNRICPSRCVQAPASGSMQVSVHIEDRPTRDWGDSLPRWPVDARARSFGALARSASIVHNTRPTRVILLSIRGLRNAS